MNGIVAGLQGCAAHLDVVIYSNTWRPCRVNQSCVQLWRGMLHCEKCMKCKCQSVHDQGEVGNISPVCSWSFPLHLYNRPDAVLGHAGFLSAPLTHLLSSAINFDLRKRLLLLLMWWGLPAAGACWGCFFVDWWWWSRSFNHSDVLFPCDSNSHHLYCSLVKEEVPALIWAVQHFEVYSHQRLEWDKHTKWSVAWRSMAVCFLFYVKPGHIVSKRADQVPRWGVFIGAPPQPHTEAGQSLIDCVCQPTMLY